MADKIKVFKPEEIEENPFPTQEEQESLGTTQKTSNDEFKNQEISEQPVHRLKPAKEIVSKALNTISKKITQAFEFTQSGAIQIGNFLDGTTGDIRISPDGITARNVDGETTFALDGVTGNAVFKGEIQSGSILTGAITITDEQGTTIIDGGGLVSTNNFATDTYFDTGQISTSSTSYVDVAGSSIAFTTTRDTRYLFLLTVGITVLRASQDERVDVAVNLDGVILTPIIIKRVFDGTATKTWFSSHTTHNVADVPAGNHTIKIQWKVEDGASTGFMIDRQLTYLRLGN